MKAFLVGFGLSAAFLGLVGVEIWCVTRAMATGAAAGWYLAGGALLFCVFAGAIVWFIFES